LLLKLSLFGNVLCYDLKIRVFEISKPELQEFQKQTQRKNTQSQEMKERNEKTTEQRFRDIGKAQRVEDNSKEV